MELRNNPDTAVYIGEKPYTFTADFYQALLDDIKAIETTLLDEIPEKEIDDNDYDNNNTNFNLINQIILFY